MGNLRAVQLLLGHTKMDSKVRYLDVELEDALAIAESMKYKHLGHATGTDHSGLCIRQTMMHRYFPKANVGLGAQQIWGAMTTATRDDTDLGNFGETIIISMLVLQRNALLARRSIRSTFNYIRKTGFIEA